jgi:hypothetical protein
MGKEQDPGDGNVSDETRTFEEGDDEQVTAGADRAPTPDEEAAAERAEPLTEQNREAYRDMAERGADQQGEGRI